MSSSIRDCGEDHKFIGTMLNDFLYEDGKAFLKKGIKGKLIEHTNEELVEMLNRVREQAWKSYDTIADEMGWR